MVLSCTYKVIPKKIILHRFIRMASICVWHGYGHDHCTKTLISKHILTVYFSHLTYWQCPEAFGRIIFMKFIQIIAAYCLGRPQNLKIVSVWHIIKVTYRDIPGLKAQLHTFSNVKWGRKIIYASTINMFWSNMPGFYGWATSNVTH